MSLTILFNTLLNVLYRQEKTSNTRIALAALEKAVHLISSLSCDDNFNADKKELLVEIVKLRCACTLQSLESKLSVALPPELRSQQLLSSPMDLALVLMELCIEISWAAHLESLRYLYTSLLQKTKTILHLDEF